MISKKEVIEKYFDNKISPKSLRKFKQKTPKGNFVSGWISMESGDYLSSMLLTEIQVPGQNKTIECERFIRGMPHQNYYDPNGWDLYQDNEFTMYSCYEKLDGTCILLYTLYDEEDNLIEIVPRTRGMAVAANHIIDMYNLVDQAQIKEFYSVPHHYDYVLMFEMFGILNRHEITYHQYYIDMRLIGATLESEVLKKNDVLSIAFNNHFSIPDLLFEICCHGGVWRIWGITSRLYPYYLDKEVLKDHCYDSLESCINALVDIMESVNERYKKVNNHIAIEGVVINGVSPEGNQRYIKIKPLSVLKMAKLGNGIPSYAIRKEAYKYFDEYGVFKVKEIYNQDKLHFLKFIQNNLLEEFPEEFVFSSKTNKKINNVFFDVWESKTPDLTIQKVCQELATKYSDKKISDVMRIFAKEYPSLKKKSRTVYSVLTYIMKEE